ncbi:hypothetical protein RBH89_13535 [Paracidovorax avenae]
MSEQDFQQRVDAWLRDPLASTDRLTAIAALANARPSLRQDAEHEARPIVIGESTPLTRTFLARVWNAMQSLLQKRAAARAIKC